MRDWQKDNHWQTEAESAQRELYLLTMQNEDFKKLYAAEKERADAAERHSVELAKQVLEVESREKKLRETLEQILKMTNKSEAYTTEARVYHEAFKTLSSLYGEKEAKG